MTEQPPAREPHGEADDVSGHDSPPGVPRWVTVFAVVTLVMALLVVVALLTGEGHGPSRHGPSAGTAHSASPAVAVSGTRR